MECVHIWHLAFSGNAYFRWRKCFAKRSTADAAVRRWKLHPPNDRGHRPAPSLGVFMVRDCDNKTRPGTCPCPCRPVK